MQNAAILNRAIKLAKRADVAIQMSTRSRASGSGSSQQMTRPSGPKELPEEVLVPRIVSLKHTVRVLLPCNLKMVGALFAVGFSYILEV